MTIWYRPPSGVADSSTELSMIERLGFCPVSSAISSLRASASESPKICGPDCGIAISNVRDVDSSRRRIPRLEELAAPECEEEQDGDGEVDAEARQEGRDLAERKPGLRDDPVGDAAVDADRREAAGLRTMDDHQTHQQRRDAVF